MAWDRVVRLTVGPGSAGVRVSGLDVSFRVERSITIGGQSASITVYNAAERTRSEILKNGNTVILEAGYADEGVGTIFTGSVIDAKTSRVGGTIKTVLSAAALRGQTVDLERISVSLSYAPGTPMSTVLRDLATFLGVAFYGARQVSMSLSNGFTFVGPARRALFYAERITRDAGVGIYIDNGALIAYRIGGSDSGTFESVYLAYNTGLISVEDVSEIEDPRRRVRFKSLLIPKLQPNGLATIESDDVSGSFIVEKVVFSGDNYGGNFSADGEAAA